MDSFLTCESKKALEQINRNQYIVDFVHRGIDNIVKIGLAFLVKNLGLLPKGLINKKLPTFIFISFDFGGNFFSAD